MAIMLSSALTCKAAAQGPLPSDCALSPTEHLFEFFWPQLTHVTCGSSEGQHESISPLAPQCVASKFGDLRKPFLVVADSQRAGDWASWLASSIWMECSRS